MPITRKRTTYDGIPRMPALFGRATGPRQRPDSEGFWPVDVGSTTATWAAARTDTEALARFRWVGGDGLVVEEVLFSPPTFMHLGIGVGAAATDQWLSLSFRHRPALLDRGAAIAFSDLFVDLLVATAGSQ